MGQSERFAEDGALPMRGSAERAACPVPADFCTGELHTLSVRDCDGDGVLDAYCEDAARLRFGYISWSSGCASTWPSGVCKGAAAESTDATREVPENEITVVHFADIYEISGILENGTRRGGLSRLAHSIRAERARNTNRTFAVLAGDFLSPSVLSTVFEGEQMVDVLNMVGLDAASVGNHELDFGMDALQRRINESDFAWLNVNLFGEDKQLIEGTQRHLIRDVPFSYSGEERTSRMCFFGAAYDIALHLHQDRVQIGYENITATSRREARHLRKARGCSVVIALTHQISDDDCALSRAIGDDVDLILGGHDHAVEMTTTCGHAPVIKPDSDLKAHWVLSLRLRRDGTLASFESRLVALADEDDVAPDVHERVLWWEERGARGLLAPIGCSAVDLDARRDVVRQQEAAIGNFFTDAIRAYLESDVAIFNGGGIRGDKIYEAGPLSHKSLLEMHPFGNHIVSIYMTGAELRGYLETQLECYEVVCGGFAHIAGARYGFDPNASDGRRVRWLVRSDGAPLRPADRLVVALTDYLLSRSRFRGRGLVDAGAASDDGARVVDALEAAVRAAGDACVAPETSGRIVLEVA